MIKVLAVTVLAVLIAEGLTLPSSRLEGRIVGGTPTRIEDHIYQVSLRTTWNAHFCGGSILSRTWVISAAHCTVSHRPDTMIVVVGTSFLNSGGTRIAVQSIINHPNFDSFMLYNDICLIRTDDIPINNVNIGITWPANHFTNPDREVVVTGWGFLQTGTNVPNQLQMLVTRTISNQVCRTLVPAAWVSEEKICTNVGAGRGICQGDSGGPLIENGWLVGIVSWNVPCAQGSPDGFERVSSHRNWIRQHTGI